MALRDLFFNILAKDKTGAAFDNVARKLRKVDGAAATVEQRLRRAGAGLAKFGGMAGAAMAPIALAFRDSLRLYDVQARAEAKVAQAVKSTGSAAGFTAEELLRMASGLQNVTRFGDEEILSKVTGQLLTFTNIAGDEFRRAQVAALDLATVLEGDVQSASIMLGKALNDPVKGLSAMSRAGVQFSEDQAAVIKSLAETGRVAEAQQMILAELEKQYGGQAAAAARAGLGALDQLSNAWGDVKEEVGRIIGELLPPVVGFVKKLVDGFQMLPEPVKRFTVIAGLLAVGLGPVVGVIGLLVMGIAALGAPVAAAIVGLGAFAAAIGALWPQIAAAGEAIADFASKAWDFLVEKFTAAWRTAADAVWKAAEAIWGYLTGKLDAALSFVVDKVNVVRSAFADLYDAVVGNSYVPDMVDAIADEFGRLPSVMVRPAEEAAGVVEGAFSDLAEGVSSIFDDMLREGDFTFKGLARSAGSFAASLASRTVDRGVGILSDFAANALGNAVSGWFSAAPMTSPVPTARPVRAATGADFMVGGRGGIDANRIDLRATRGERVRVYRAGERPGGAAARPVYVTIQTPDPRSFSASRAQISRTVAGAVSRAGRVS